MKISISSNIERQWFNAPWKLGEGMLRINLLFTKPISRSLFRYISITSAIFCSSILHLFQRTALSAVDLGGIEPPPPPCHGDVLPLNYRPKVSLAQPKLDYCTLFYGKRKLECL